MNPSPQLSPPLARTGEASALRVDDLHVALGGQPIVNGVSFAVAPGRTLALVGESGAGKSMTAKAIMGLLPAGAALTGGTVCIGGRDTTGLSETEWRRVRGREIAMVFQNPMRSLNPTITVGAQIGEAIRTHDRTVGRRVARERAAGLLRQVQIPDPERRCAEYPHQLSGGMRQRVVIAMALACSPAVLVADEPTTALDVTTQAGILQLLRELQAATGMGIVLVTHDIRIAEDTAHDVAVMYAGRIVEHGPVAAVVHDSRNPYTDALMSAIPRPDTPPGTPLPVIAGRPPAPSAMPPGCAFAPRCPRATERCSTRAPDMTRDAGGHGWACWHPAKGDPA